MEKTVNYSMEFQRIYKLFGRGCRQMLCLLFHMTSTAIIIGHSVGRVLLETSMELVSKTT